MFKVFNGYKMRNDSHLSDSVLFDFCIDFCKKKFKRNPYKMIYAIEAVDTKLGNVIVSLYTGRKRHFFKIYGYVPTGISKGWF